MGVCEHVGVCVCSICVNVCDAGACETRLCVCPVGVHVRDMRDVCKGRVGVACGCVYAVCVCVWHVCMRAVRVHVRGAWCVSGRVRVHAVCGCM